MSEIPVCRDCSHLVGKRLYIEDARNWKCGHPSNVASTSKDAVTGADVYTFLSPNCYDTRKGDGACGIAGSLFEPYERPQPPAGKPARLPSADDLLGELGQ